MSSLLERIPHEIQQQIALLSVSSSPLQPPSAVASLLRTNRTIHASISTQNCPYLYSSIFHAKFDTAAIARRLGTPPTTSAFTTELMNRFSALRRIYSGHVHPEHVGQDLWTVLRMLLESDGLNEWHLQAVGLVDYALSVYQIHQSGVAEETKSLALLILSLSISRESIAARPNNWIQDLLLRARPVAVSALNSSDPESFYSLGIPERSSSSIIPKSATAGHTSDSLDFRSTLPHPSLAAVLLTFALVDETPFQRLHAHGVEEGGNTNQVGYPAFLRVGFDRLRRCRAPLFADSTPRLLNSEFTDLDWSSDIFRRIDASRSILHDRGFYRSLLQPDFEEAGGASSADGSINGLWEGSYMIHPSVAFDAEHPELFPDFICRQPIQIFFGTSATTTAPDSRTNHRDTHVLPIEGKTLPVHGEIWGYYSCKGEIRLSDGLVTLRRRSIHHDFGAWTFEGYVQCNSVLVGRCWSGPTLSESCMKGVFCLRRNTDTADASGTNDT